ncbi:Fasciclin-2 [Folsomia candida]|uniref:Fasciclin-2 n=1 Tax=Folsomia candida TaxID=158441 RepID=A0A226E1K8_FOLCA|nr:Fasciclin-2 [Folsomia candida]
MAHADSLTFVLILAVITLVNGVPYSLSHREHRTSFQDLSQDEFVQDLRSLRSGHAPIQIDDKGHSRKNGNILWGLENKWRQLRCIVQASPVAEFQWKFRGLSIDPDAADRNILATLGEYTCRASNELGASERNFFLSRASKPPTPDFDTIVVPNSGILVSVTGFHNRHRKNLHIIQTRGFVDKDELGEILPIKGYALQFRKMASCDPWTNITFHSEKKFLRHHLVPGTLYRMRLAARTEGGIGEFSAARTVNYRLPDDKESDDADEETGTEDPAVDLSSISDSRRSSEYSDESSRSVENNDPTSSTDS